MALHLLLLDVLDPELPRFDRRNRALGIGLVREAELVQPLTSSMLRRAWKSAPLGVVNAAWMLQYSSGLNASISFSRSQIRRSATDCTRPAEREPCSLRQSTGDSVKPTR